jgi:hypothetical protein
MKIGDYFFPQLLVSSVDLSGSATTVFYSLSQFSHPLFCFVLLKRVAARAAGHSGSGIVATTGTAFKSCIRYMENVVFRAMRE